MRLKRLNIGSFKNLNGFELNFEDKEGLTVLIGNNGSGKSNIIEAISEIFAKLFMAKTTSYKVLNKSVPSFYFIIEYTLNDTNIKIDFLEEHNEYRFFINDELASRANVLQYKNNYLPSQIIANYSGEEDRLYEKYYSHFYKSYIKALTNSQLLSYPKQELLYIDSYYWSISFLTMLYSQLSNVHEFLSDYLNVSTVNEIEVVLKKPAWARNGVFTSENRANNTVIRFLYELYSLKDSEITIRESKKTSFKITNDIVQKLQSIQSIGTEKEFFISMSAAYCSGLVESINIRYNTVLNIESMSEGQKKLILTKAILEFLSDENALVLLDEPDSHIHIANKIKFKDLLLSYENRENIITTHSPTLTHSFDEKHITMINQGQIEDRQKQEIFSHITEGIWNYQEQSVFLSSPYNTDLIVEGKFDKIHIETAIKSDNLGEDFPDLKFGIFDLKSCDNMKKMFDGLCNADNLHIPNKKIIFIFDNEKQFFNGQNLSGKEFQGAIKIKDDLYKKNGIYLIFLPKKIDFIENFTIENMYPSEKFRDCLQETLTRRLPDNAYFNNFIDHITDGIKEDAKKLLSEKCLEYEKGDFIHFKELFDLIHEIHNIPIVPVPTANQGQ
jgi:ABC-type cobalamin/Fe3+-siderophores transport system ATPase subunit